MLPWARVLIAAVLASALLLALPAQQPFLVASADGEEEYGRGYEDYGEEEEEYEDGGGDVAEALGEAAFYGGLAANALFLLARWARFVAPLPPQLQRLALELHMDANLVLGPLGLIHGYMFIERAGPVEYAAAALIVLLLVTGLVMRLSRGKTPGRVARLIHAQRVFAIALLVLLAVHVAARED